MDIRKNNLETRIMRILGHHGLVKKDELTRPIIRYEPRERGKGYRWKRRIFIKCYPHLCLIGGGTAVGLGILEPDFFKISLGIGGGVVVAGVAGHLVKTLAPLDRFLYHNPTDIAIRHFRNEAGIPPHYEAYKYFQDNKPKNRLILDDYVIMAETSSAIKRVFHHSDFQRTLGIIIGSTADFLSEFKFDSYFPGFKFHDFQRMILRQEKLGTPEETRKAKVLCRDYSNSQLFKILNKLNKDKNPEKILEHYARKNNLKKRPEDVLALEILNNFYRNGEAVLNIFDANGEYYIGSEISKGQLVIERTGDYAGSYAGKHSRDLEFPRIYVNGNVGDSFMEGASRGLGVVEGDAGYGVLKDATGGVAIISGNARHGFCVGMTHYDWPAIGMCKGSLERKLYSGDMENGMIICLNLNNQNSPTYYFFQDGVLKSRKSFKDDYDGLKEILKRINTYVGLWKRGNMG